MYQTMMDIPQYRILLDDIRSRDNYDLSVQQMHDFAAGTIYKDAQRKIDFMHGAFQIIRGTNDEIVIYGLRCMIVSTWDVEEIDAVHSMQLNLQMFYKTIGELPFYEQTMKISQ